MNENSIHRVLCVDDEPNVLAGLRRTLRGKYEVTTAAGASAGLAAVRDGEPFSVVISDLRMPEMDGITFLERARELTPDTQRILLTGQADMGSALDAVNRGAVFRFLLKPCASEQLESSIAAAVEQHLLVTAERVLLQQTLNGSLRALTDVLALISPAGFGRAARAKALVAEVSEEAGLEPQWQVEIAAMLSQIGIATLAPNTVEKIYDGGQLTYAETVAMERLPKVASDVIAHIPRLEEVRTILECQNLRFDGKGSPPDAPRGGDIPWGSRVLKLVLDFDVLESRGLTAKAALGALQGRSGFYDPEVLDLLVAARDCTDSKNKVLELEIGAVRPGMHFAEDVRTTTGILLVARGQEVSDHLAERIRNLLHLVEAKQKVRVFVPDRRQRGEPLDIAIPAVPIGAPS